MYGIVRCMFVNRRVKAFICKCAAVLLIGTSYHCAIEELISTLSTSILGGTPSSGDNGCGGTTCEHRNDSSQSHEHGQTHQLLVLKAEKASAALNKIFKVLISIIPLLFFLRRLPWQPNSVLLELTNPLHTPPEHLRDLIASLTFAPQAPPLPH